MKIMENRVLVRICSCIFMWCVLVIFKLKEFRILVSIFFVFMVEVVVFVVVCNVVFCFFWIFNMVDRSLGFFFFKVFWSFWFCFCIFWNVVMVVDFFFCIFWFVIWVLDVIVIVMFFLSVNFFCMYGVYIIRGWDWIIIFFGSFKFLCLFLI